MLVDTVKDERFKVTPLFVEQSEFNRTTYRDGAPHFFSGCFIKQEMILHILKQVPEGTYFLFTDVDLAILRQDALYDFLKRYTDRQIDMVYMHENQNKEYAPMNCNVGFALIRASTKTRNFFEEVMRQARTTTDKFDMEIMTPLFPNFPGRIETFDPTRIVLSNQFTSLERPQDAIIVQLLCGNNSDYRKNMMQKYSGAKAFGIHIEKYLEEALRAGRSPDELGLPLPKN